MVALHVVFGAKKEGQGNILCLRVQLDGVVAFVTHGTFAAPLEVQSAAENLFRFVGQCPFHVDLCVGLLAYMVDVIEKVQVLFPLGCINGAFLHRGFAARKTSVTVDDDFLAAQFSSGEVCLRAFRQFHVPLVIDDDAGKAAFQAGHLEIRARLKIVIRRQEAGALLRFPCNLPHQREGRVFFYFKYKLRRHIRLRLACRQGNGKFHRFAFRDADFVMLSCFRRFYGFLRCAVKVCRELAPFFHIGRVGESDVPDFPRRFKKHRRIIGMQIPVGKKRQTVDSDFFHSALLIRSRLQIPNR